jgi:hypothetical protein
MLVASVGCTGSYPGVSLTAFVDQDLRSLEDKSKGRLSDLLAGSLPERYQSKDAWAFEPWYLWRHEARNGRALLILFQGRHILMIPGQSYAAIHFLDPTGGHLSCAEFSTGWRIDLESAVFRHDEAFGGPVIEITTEPVINGRDIHRQVYGVFNDRVALLRLEDSEGSVVDNNYHNPNHTIGPDAPTRTADEWEESLRSSDVALVLESLTWLGGFHRRDLTPASDNIGVEDITAARLVAEIRQRPSVQKAITELLQSQNQWIRAAAIAAQRRLAE